ncbi:MAG TPA: lipoyl synthase, partial [Candidatus Bathyarchaeia archaeon]|nr:lipoyl synthase [Candidatus Bathyarchaeia archaeon]
TGTPEAVDPQESQEVAQMVKELGLAYVVITSVTRDDLEDEGAFQFVRTVEAIRQMNPATKIELLIPDFSGRAALIRQVVDAAPDVLGHNIEMAGQLFPEIRPQAGYRRSLEVLRQIKGMAPAMIVKSGFMVGLGEDDQDVYEVMKDLRRYGCDLLTIGQYLAPSQGSRHVAVQRFVTPGMFEAYRAWGAKLGFRHVLSAPLVRSSYIAETGYQQCLEKMAA